MSAQQYWWAPGIVSMPAMSIGTGTGGGYARVTWGSIGFAPNAFIGPPPSPATISLDWGIVSSSVLHIFDGSIILRAYTSSEISYDLYEPVFDTKLLAEGTDETGEDVVQPLVIGTVNYMTPQRTGDDTLQRYYMPNFASYHFYDDGVLIDDHWAISGGYAERYINLVGSLSISGTGNMTTVSDVFAWAATRLGVAFVDVHGADTPLNCAVSSQQLLVDFLDKIAYYAGYQFTISDNVLTLVSVQQDNGEQTLDKYDSVSLTYSWPMPVKSYTANWTTRIFDAEAESLIDDDQEVIHYTGSTMGDEVTLSVYDEDPADVTDKITAIATMAQRVQVSLSLPLDQLPNIGEKINFVDRKLSHNISGYMRVRKYDLDYRGKKLNIQGVGEITF